MGIIKNPKIITKVSHTYTLLEVGGRTPFILDEKGVQKENKNSKKGWSKQGKGFNNYPPIPKAREVGEKKTNSPIPKEKEVGEKRKEKFKGRFVKG